MSIFSFLGKAAKTVGKAALGVTKTAVNVAGTYVGVGPILGGGSAPVSMDNVATSQNVAAAGSLTNGAAPQGAGGSLGSTLMGFMGAATDFLTGKTHAQVDANVGVGNNQSNSGLPSWLLPVGGAVALILLLSSRGNGRR